MRKSSSASSINFALKQRSQSIQAFSKTDRIVGVVLALLAFAGCEARGPRIAVPTRDEVALVDGEPLTLSAFLTIRDQLKNPSKENAFWVGVATLAIRKDLANRGQSMPDPAPFEIALYARGTTPAGDHQKSYFGMPLPDPDDARKRLDQLISRLVVQRNPQVLAGL